MAKLAPDQRWMLTSLVPVRPLPVLPHDFRFLLALMRGTVDAGTLVTWRRSVS